MKKLLTFLGAIGLSVSSGITVISCGHKSPNSNDNNITPQDPVKDITDAFNRINSSVYLSDDSLPKLTRTVSDDGNETDGYKMFTLNYLKNLDWSTEKKTLIQIPLDKVWTDVSNDLNLFFLKQQFIDQINDNIAPKQEFQKLYLGSPEKTIGDFAQPKGGDGQLEVTRLDENMFNVKFSYTKSFNYKDQNGTKQTYTSDPQLLRALIGTDGAILQAVGEISKALPPQIYNDITSQLTFTQMRDTDGKFKQYGNINEPLFKTFNAPDVNKKQNKIKAKIQEVIKAKADTNKFGNISLAVADSGLISKPDNVVQNDTLFNFKNADNMAERSHETLNNIDFNNNPIIKNLIFNKKDSDIQVSDDDAQTAFSTIIPKIDENVGSFETKLNDFFNNDGKGIPDDSERTTHKKLTKTCYSYGIMNIDGVGIQMSNSKGKKQTIAIPPIKVPWIYSVEVNEDKQVTFFKGLRSSLAAINEKFLWNAADSDAKSLLNSSDDLKQDMYDMFGATASEIDGNFSGGKRIRADHFSNTGYNYKNHNYYDLCERDGHVAKSLLNDANYQFNNFSAYMLSINYDESSSPDIYLAKNKDGKIGIKTCTRDSSIVFKINLDNIQFRVALPVPSIEGQIKPNDSIGAYTGADISNNYTDKFLPEGMNGQDWQSAHFSDDDYFIFDLV